MLTEFHGVTQEANGRRRCFEASGLDLTVWYGVPEEISGFQLGYEARGRSWALTWREGHGFNHDVVLTGDTTPFKNQTPILEPMGVAPWPDLIARFAKNSTAMEPALSEFILKTLSEGQATAAVAQSRER